MERTGNGLGTLKLTNFNATVVFTKGKIIDYSFIDYSVITDFYEPKL